MVNRESTSMKFRTLFALEHYSAGFESNWTPALSRYTVLERTKEFKKFGGPIQLASNAMQGLQDLDADLSAGGIVPFAARTAA